MTSMPTVAFPALPHSVLAPVLIGLPSKHSHPKFLELAWRAAVDSVPATEVHLNVPVRGKAKPLAVAHTRYIQHGSNGPLLLAALVDRRADEDGATAWQRWRWKVQGTLVTDASHAGLVGDAAVIFRLDVSCYQLRAGVFDQAAQLALFRHYVISGLQSLDNAAVVVGGQQHWQAEWWQPAPAVQA